jgi:hypothetical protein
MDAYNQKKNFAKVTGEAEKFMAINPEYYDCPHNNKILGELLADWKLEPTAVNLDAAYVQLLAERKILGKLPMADITKMDSPTYDARLKIDPAMGGAITDIETRGNAKFAAPQSYKTGGFSWQQMERANLALRQKDADFRASVKRGSR